MEIELDVEELEKQAKSTGGDKMKMSRTEIKTYKGYTIFFDESFEKFKAENENGDEITSNVSLKLLEASLERLSKSLFRKVSVWYKEYGDWMKANITSYNPDDESGWISVVKGSRHKLDDDYDWEKVYRDNEKNSKIITQWKELDNQIEQIETQKVELEKTMEIMPLSELKKNLQPKKELR